MSFVPALCLGCSRVALVSLADAQRGELLCNVCEGQVRVVPGCSFAAEDREQFQELSDIVARPTFSPTEAQGYAAETRRALWSGAYAPHLEKLTVRFLGLLPLHLAIGKNFAAQRRVLIKLQIIFEAIATARRASAEYPIVPELVTRARKA
jgi:hypothetical protein